LVKSYNKWSIIEEKIELKVKGTSKFTCNKCNNKFNKSNNKKRLGKESILGENNYKRRKLQRFLSSMVEVIPKSTLIGRLKLNKFSMKIM